MKGVFLAQLVMSSGALLPLPLSLGVDLPLVPLLRKQFLTSVPYTPLLVNQSRPCRRPRWHLSTMLMAELL